MSKQTAKEMTTVRFNATGKMFVNGISSSYEEKYDSELGSVLSRDEHFEIVSRLNSTLSAYWPCGLVYFTGCILAPCTLGLSLLCPMMCVSEAETRAARLLESLSLKAKYFDRDISFRLEKGCMTSQFVISFPPDEECYLLGKNSVDEEWGGVVGSADDSSVTGRTFGIQVEPGTERSRLKYT